MAPPAPVAILLFITGFSSDVADGSTSPAAFSCRNPLFIKGVVLTLEKFTKVIQKDNLSQSFIHQGIRRVKTTLNGNDFGVMSQSFIHQGFFFGRREKSARDHSLHHAHGLAILYSSSGFFWLSNVDETFALYLMSRSFIDQGILSDAWVAFDILTQPV